MEAMAWTLIDMRFGIRRHLLSFPGKLIAYGLAWPDLVDRAIKCVSLLTSGRDQAEEQAFYDQQIRVPQPLRLLAKNFLHLLDTGDHRRIVVHYEEYVIVWADSCPEGGGLTVLTQEGDTLELQVGYSSHIKSTHSTYVELKMLAVVTGRYYRAYKQGNTNMMGGNDLFVNKLIIYFTDSDSGSFGITFRHLKGGLHCKLIREIWNHVNGMHSTCKAYHVAGKRMDIQGEDGKSRQRNVTSSLPDMWLEAMSSIIPPSSLI